MIKFLQQFLSEYGRLIDFKNSFTAFTIKVCSFVLLQQLIFEKTGEILIVYLEIEVNNILHLPGSNHLFIFFKEIRLMFLENNSLFPEQRN